MKWTPEVPHIARGFLMGGADIIPGVSGGTVALILGIYERLVTAISHFDAKLLVMVKEKRFKDAADHIDLRFLMSLGIGVLCGIVGLASLMHYLLEHQLQYTFATFFGLILGSSWLVAKMVPKWTPQMWIGLVGGIAFAFWLVGLPLLHSPPSGLHYIFFCGFIAICAMILPGISGSFILLILGTYSTITGVIKGIPKGNIDGDGLALLAVLALGCASGLILFSKVLRWLLKHYEPVTMAILCGIMLGSLRKLWPFKDDLTPYVEKFKEKDLVNEWPGTFNGETLLTFGLMIVATSFIVGLNHFVKIEEVMDEAVDDIIDAEESETVDEEKPATDEN